MNNYNEYPKAYISLKKLIHNAEVVKNLLQNEKFYAVVKSDAYGHGYEISTYIENIVDGYCVSRVYEGVKLRYMGITKPILCLLPPHKDEIISAINYNIDISLDSELSLNETISICNKKQNNINVHFAVDTGMNRIGFSDINSFEKTLNLAKKSKFIKVISCFSHFYNSKSSKVCEKQSKKFKLYENLFYENFDGITHISASGGLIQKKFNRDLVRIGILLYGYKPFNADIDVKPVMTITGGFIKQKYFNGNEIALYNEKPKIGVYGLTNYGYADGLFRKRTNFTPNKCMDLGYYPIINNKTIIMSDALTLAKFNHTITYEILVNSTKRIEKIYIN